VLAAIVLAAIAGLVNTKAIARLWRFNRMEFAIAAVAFVGVLGQGILRGVLLGAVLSLIILLRRGSQPHAAELGRVGDSEVFATLSRGEDRSRMPGALVFRADGALLYFNVDYVRDRFFEALDARTDPITRAVFFLGTTPAVDLAGADMLMELRHALAARGIDLRLAGAHGDVRAALVRAGFEEKAVFGHPTVLSALAG
jgi:MFS superfamily sulfate permease-like transporter